MRTATGSTWIPSQISPAIEGVVGERHADRAGRPVTERRHGVEQMGHRRCAGALGVGHARGIGVGVPDRDDDAFPDELFDHFERARQLRRDGHHDHTGVPRPSVDHGRRREVEPPFRMRATARRGEHRTFEVEPDRDRSPAATPACGPVSREGRRVDREGRR